MSLRKAYIGARIMETSDNYARADAPLLAQPEELVRDSDPVLAPRNTHQRQPDFCEFIALAESRIQPAQIRRFSLIDYLAGNEDCHGAATYEFELPQ